jgi:signal transduction histidine kinase
VQIILLDAPDTLDGAFLAGARSYGNVIVGRAIGADPDASAVPAAADGGDGAMLDGLPVGALALPTAESGVHRYAATRVRVGGHELPTLAALAARRLGRDPPAGSFRVNFNQGPDWIPRVSLDRVRGRGLIAELVAGRSVLIGSGRGAAEPGLHTPANPSGPGMSLLAYQAHALDTLLQDRQIRATPWTLKLLIFGLIGLLNLIVYQWFNLDRSSWFTASLVAIYLGAAWLLLHGLRIWLPVAEIALAQLLMFWLFVRLKLVRDDLEMRHTVLRRMAHLQDYMLPPDFYRLDEHWAQVITFVDQTLNLNRVIFLEKVEGDHRVREVQALRCSLEDIDERRRDFERLPYSDAIAEGGPIRLDRRLFFADAGDGEFQQYLVPLLFAGEVQGFWAFDVDPQEIESSENFLGNIRNFGNQIAELLYHRHRWIEQRDAETAVFRRFFRLEAVKASSQEVNELLDLLDKRLHAVQAVFDGLGTATIQYDLFGRVVQLNSSMEGFMKEQDLPGYKLTALDLLVRLTGIAQQRARRLLQQVVVDRRDFHLPVILQDRQGGRCAVHVRPLTAGERETGGAESTAPFELAGILFELNWERGLSRRSETRDQLLEWLRLRLRAELGALLEDEAAQQELAAAAGSDLAWSARAAAADSRERPRHRVQRADAGVHDRVVVLLGVLEKVQGALTGDLTDVACPSQPVDLHPLLSSVIAGLRGAAADKRVELDAEVPRLMGLVNACPEKLAELLRALLEVLLADAATDGVVSVRVDEEDGGLVIRFDDAGFGIPDARLQAYLWQPEHEVSEDFRALRQAVQPVADWGGEIAVHSEVGVGIWARLRLEVLA